MSSSFGPPKFVSTLPEATAPFWWIGASYNPFGKLVRGIPIDQISPDWCYANEFSMNLFPAEYMKDFTPEPQFAVESTFGLGTKFTTLVGAFETCAHAKGLFVLVIEQQTDKPVVRLLEQHYKHNGILHLHVTERDTVDLWWCFDCDHSNELAWDAKTKSFIWRSWEGDADDAEQAVTDTPPVDAGKRVEAGEAQPDVAGGAAPKSGAAPLN